MFTRSSSLELLKEIDRLVNLQKWLVFLVQEATTLVSQIRSFSEFPKSRRLFLELYDSSLGTHNNFALVRKKNYELNEAVQEKKLHSELTPR